ncbi:MAG: nucleotidyltransferase domain-containing protein [Niameybacter sp.]|uniref:nucleotidyltransferase family protein n=1 Tax=Niameybacter sp. TaxID=2033640 RepID=UPI002FC709E8
MVDTLMSIEELNTRDKFKKALRVLIEEISTCNKINQIIVFGSVAKGVATENSDIDICILSDEDEFTLLTDSTVNDSFLKLIRDGIDTHFDVLVYNSVSELKIAFETTFMSVEKAIYEDGITVFKRGAIAV